MFASTLTTWLRRYAGAEDGGVLPLMGVAAVALIAIMGLAIDAGRATIVYAKLLTSADASGLAVGARMSSADLNAEAQKFVDANFPAGYAGATIQSVTASANADGSVITINATAVMPTTLLRLVGVDSIDLDVTSEISRAVSGLELVLALDNTGSMEGSKLTGLKTASKDLLDIVFGDGPASDDLFVGVVPFSQAVNIGSSRTGWMAKDSVAALDWGPTSWAGCVEARAEFADQNKTVTRDTTDDPPQDQADGTTWKFKPYYWPDNSNDDNSSYYSQDYNPNDWRDWHTEKVCTRWNKKGKCNRTGDKIVYDYDLSSGKGPNRYCPAAVTAMTSSKSKAVDAIEAMTAVGNTHVNLGAVWGWRMLSPRWRGFWGGEMDTKKLPLDYNTPRMNKAIVIMTDGDNTMSRSIYTAYGFLSDQRLGSNSSTQAEAALDTRLTTVCNNMKNAGIIVYTVAFGTMTTATKDLLENCATKSEYYFASPTSTELSSAFKTIGDSLSNLRVSK